MRAPSPCLPRARGDVSESGLYALIFGSPSPRTRGCFQLRLFCKGRSKAFPAHAGMFLQTALEVAWALGLPRARGDVSDVWGFDSDQRRPSPRTQGCFRHAALDDQKPRVFPVHAGMFL